jgi:hypothetical protein
MTEQAQRGVQRSGGLAGIAGSVLFLAVFVIVGVFAGPEPAGPAGPISRFLEIRTARTVENGLYLAVLMLWACLSLGLSHRLLSSRPAPAIFGGGLNLLGLAVLAAGALPHVVTLGLAQRYHAAEATAGERETLVLQWQAVQGMFDALLITGLLMMAVGVTLFARAMFAIGKGTAVAALVSGIISLAAAVAALIDPHSMFAALCVFALIGFHFVAGWKLYRGSPRNA